MKPLILPSLIVLITLSASCSKNADQAAASSNVPPPVAAKSPPAVVHPKPTISLGVSPQSQPQIQATPEMIKNIRLEPQQQAAAKAYAAQNQQRVEQLSLPKDAKLDQTRGASSKPVPARVESVDTRRQARLQAMSLIRPSQSPVPPPAATESNQGRPN